MASSTLGPALLLLAALGVVIIIILIVKVVVGLERCGELVGLLGRLGTLGSTQILLLVALFLEEKKTRTESDSKLSQVGWWSW